MADEELILSVDIDDKASAKIADLKRQLDGLGGAPAFGRMREQSEGATRGIRGLSGELSAMASRMGFIGGVVGGITSKLTEMGVEAVARVTDLRAISMEMGNMSTAAYRMGTSVGQLRENMQAFREGGVSADAAKRNIEGLTESVADLSLVNSQLRMNIMRGGFLPVEQMREGLAGVDAASTLEQKANALKKLSESVRDYWMARGRPELAAVMEKRFLGMIRVEDLDQVIRGFRAVTAEQRILDESRKDANDKYIAQQAAIDAGYERIGRSITAIRNNINEATGASKIWLDALQGIGRTLETLEHGELTPKAAKEAIQDTFAKFGVGVPTGSASEDTFARFGVPPAVDPYGNAMPLPFRGGGGARGGAWDSRGFTGKTGNKFWDELQGRSDVDIEDRRAQEDNTTETERLTEQMRTLNDTLTTPAPPGSAVAALGLNDLGGGKSWTGGGGGGRAMPQGLRGTDGGGGGGAADRGEVPKALRPDGGGGGAKTYEGGTAGQKTAQVVANELRKEGFSEAAIAGVLANAKEEVGAGLDPTLRHADQPKFGGEAHFAHGLMQEGGAEWNIWAEDMKKRGLDPMTAWKDPKEQMRFFAGRLKGTIGNKQYAKVWEALQNAKSPGEAAAIIARDYLKPAAPYLRKRLGEFEQRGVPGVEAYTGTPSGDAAAAAGGGTDRVEEAQARVAAIRRQPIDPRLKEALDYAAEQAGVKVRVTSGGQDPHGVRTGSHRHDLGRAADLDVIDPETGKTLALDDPRRLKFLERAAAAGAGGSGARYMSDPRKLHVGITGSSGRIGEGLGMYAGTAEERAAVQRGLAHRLTPEQMAERRDARAMDNAIARGAELDREREMTVTGQGKLQVEINGPPGVKASASGEGLLKDVTVSKRVQMEPAAVGPPEGSPY